MQGAWGWATFKPHSSEAPTGGPWQGQWESHGGAEGSGWESGTWDQLNKGDGSHYEEFENVMHWDDSGAREAFEIATKIQEGSLSSSLSFPSPDLYIQVIDWDSREDLKLPDSAETFSQHGERNGQRKRGRKGGAFRRQFDRQDFTNVADQKLNGKPSSDSVCFNEVKPQGDDALFHGASNVPVLDGLIDSSQRDGLPYQLQNPVQDRSRSNWSAQWNSQPHQRQNFAKSNWQDHGRSNWDEWHNLQTHQSCHRWQQQTNVSHDPVRGWGRGGIQPRDSRGLLNDPRHQSTLAAPISNSGNERMCQGEANSRGVQQQGMVQFNRGSKQQHHWPTHFPDNSRRWRQQEQPYQPWQ